MTKKRSTKRALLLSALSLLVCVSMFVGSTFAWFTDSVVSGSNVIQSGNLDLEVQYTLDGKKWADLDGATDLFQNGLWEPGHTEVVALKIENKGSLALKYAASMNIFNEVVGTNKDGGDIVLSDILTVSSMPMDGGALGGALAGTIFSSDDASIWKSTDVKNSNFKAGNILANDNIVFAGEDAYVLIKVDMAETVGNEANHKGPGYEPSIEFGLTVLATQYTNENDSFGNQYDADAEYPVLVTNKQELKDALNNGATNINAGGANMGDLNYGLNTTTVPAGKTVTISNAKFEGKSYGNAVAGTVIFENCTFTNTGAYSIHFDAGSGNVIFKNCTLEGWCSFGTAIKSVEMIDCNLKGNGTYAMYRFYQNTTMTNCTIECNEANIGDTYPDGISAVSGCTVTMNGCTMVAGDYECAENAKIVADGAVVAESVNDAYVWIKNADR